VASKLIAAVLDLYDCRSVSGAPSSLSLSERMTPMYVLDALADPFHMSCEEASWLDHHGVAVFLRAPLLITEPAPGSGFVGYLSRHQHLVFFGDNSCLRLMPSSTRLYKLADGIQGARPPLIITFRLPPTSLLYVAARPRFSSYLMVLSSAFSLYQTSWRRPPVCIFAICILSRRRYALPYALPCFILRG
jgi:hypothetical protein